MGILKYITIRVLPHTVHWSGSAVHQFRVGIVRNTFTKALYSGLLLFINYNLMRDDRMCGLIKRE